MADMTGGRIRPETLHAFCVAAMVKAGLREADARITADVLVTTDTWGTFTHGTKHLRSYLRKARAGGIDLQAVPELIHEGPAWALVDGKKAMAMVPSVMAMNLAIRKAKACGIGYAGVRHSTHFGAAGYYANMAVEHDMIGLAMSNVDTNMTAPGARGSVIGNNPFAYAAPAGAAYPIMLDVALSAVAAGKIYAAQALGKAIPGNWLVDDEGLPTTDISNYPRVGSLLPMAGHKGYGLAVMVEVLAAVLTGAAVTGHVRPWLGPTIGEMTDEGHAFIVIDVAQMMPVAEFKARMDGMIREIHAAPKAKGAERIYLPGEMEWERRTDALTNGIALPADVLASLQGLAEDAGLDPQALF
jgi:LDH2 family malate/lactate/ureidoglycolate dehydrogenase